MRGLIQRVSSAQVTVEEKVVGAIDSGILLFLGIKEGDTEKELRWMLNKVLNLRIFCDAQGKMNRSLLDVQGGLLIVSQFTLYANCSAGRRPSFTEAAPPEQAESLYECFITLARKELQKVATGEFGAKMAVQLVNDGPVTLFLETPF